MIHLRGILDSFYFSVLKVCLYKVGHKNCLGEGNYILQLLNRSRAVLDFIHNHYPIEKLEYKLIGFGESDPVESNNTEYGRIKNRRVEITL